MAINITAKNLHIDIEKKYFVTSKNFEETSEKITIVATDDKLTLISNKKVQIKGNKS